MHIFELHYPGRSLRDKSDSLIREIFRQLEINLARAGVSLALYETVRLKWEQSLPEPSWVRRMPLAYAIAEELESRLPSDPDERQRFLQQTPAPDLTARRQEWGQGIMPDDYKKQLPFIYAHEVLYALDSVGSLLKILAEVTGIEEAKAAEKDFKVSLPNVRDIRNSAHHMEDRIRGLKAHGKPIDLEGIKNGIFGTRQATLSLSNIFNDKLGYVAADGNYYELEISVATVTKAQEAIQRAIRAVEWTDDRVRVNPDG